MNDDMEFELKPCPKCDGVLKNCEGEDEFSTNELHSYHYIQCSNCGFYADSSMDIYYELIID